MPALLTRRSTLLALLTASLAFFALPGLASAGANIRLKPGVYDGIWHTDKVKITIEKVFPDGKFTGNVHFDPSSRWPNYRFDLEGCLERNGSVTIRRVGDNCNQVATTAPERGEGRNLVWRGSVSGDGLDRPYAFELKVPLDR
jgi:hypothetical protein